MKWILPLLWYLHVITFTFSFLYIDTYGLTTHFWFKRSRSNLPLHRIKTFLHTVTYFRTSTLWISLRDTLRKKLWNIIPIDTWHVWKMNSLHPQGYHMFGIIYILHTCEILFIIFYSIQSSHYFTFSVLSMIIALGIYIIISENK